MEKKLLVLGCLVRLCIMEELHLSFIGDYDVIYIHVVYIMHYDVINLGISWGFLPNVAILRENPKSTGKC